jgi:hypothetical protein
MTLEDYFEIGRHITTTPSEIQTKLWRLVYATEWIEKSDSTFLQYPVKYIRVPSWHPEVTSGSDKPFGNNHYYGSKDPNQYPLELVEVANDIIQSPIFDAVKGYRELKLKYLSMWNGAGDLPWHSDIKDSTDMIVLVYLTEEQIWNESWGGTIEFRKEVNSKELYYEKTLPMTGNMIILNNTNPLMQHRVTPMLNKEINRYTFNFCYSWT